MYDLIMGADLAAVATVPVGGPVVPGAGACLPRPGGRPVPAVRSLAQVGSSATELGLSACLVALTTASDALEGFAVRLEQAGDRDLAAILTLLDTVAARAAAGRVAVTSEAVRRGVVAGSQSRNTTGWVREHAPSQRGQGAGTTARVAEVICAPGREQVRAAVLEGAVPPAVALTVVGEFDRLAPRLTDEASPTVLGGMLQVAAAEGSRGVAAVAPELVRRFGRPGDLQAEQDALALRVALSRPAPDGRGTVRYELTADAITRATIEAAIGPLSAPSPGADGSPDPRTSEQRRGQALAEVCRRVTAAARAARDAASPVRPGPTAMTADASRPIGPGGDARVPTASVPAGSVAAASVAAASVAAASVAATSVAARPGAAHRTADGPTGPVPGSAAVKATLFLTMSLEDLMDRTGAAETVGSLDSGTLIAPETARRIACDAAVVPVVLGSHGEVLDMGHRVRLFTPGQTRALWLRDGQCTFSGCDAPAFWCDAHHLVHWADGGPTSVANAALLCGRHHSVVHRDRLLGRVADTGGVEWDLRPGSYDLWLVGHRPTSDQPAAGAVRHRAPAGSP
jgi:hypothetical protein